MADPSKQVGASPLTPCGCIPPPPPTRAPEPQIPSCLPSESFRSCRERLFSESYSVFFPIVLGEFHRVNPDEKRALLQLLKDHEADLFLYLGEGGYRPPYPVAPALVLGALVEYDRFNPDSEFLTTGLRKMIPPFVEQKGCFSSARFDFLRKKKKFLYASGTERSAWKYLPLISASLTAGNCSDREVEQVLVDQAYIGGPGSHQLVKWIADNRWIDTAAFGRAFMDYMNLIPPKREFHNPILRAILLLLPLGGTPDTLSDEDKRLIDAGLGSALDGLSLRKGRKMVKSLADQRPAYRSWLMKVAGPFGTSQ